MSTDHLTLINRWLGMVLIALYIAMGYFVISDLLPSSAIVILLTGSREQ